MLANARSPVGLDMKKLEGTFEGEGRREEGGGRIEERHCQSLDVQVEVPPLSS